MRADTAAVLRIGGMGTVGTAAFLGVGVESTVVTFAVLDGVGGECTVGTDTAAALGVEGKGTVGTDTALWVLLILQQCLVLEVRTLFSKYQ